MLLKKNFLNPIKNREPLINNKKKIGIHFYIKRFNILFRNEEFDNNIFIKLPLIHINYTTSIIKNFIINKEVKKDLKEKNKFVLTTLCNPIKYQKEIKVKYKYLSINQKIENIKYLKEKYFKNRYITNTQIKKEKLFKNKYIIIDNNIIVKRDIVQNKNIVQTYRDIKYLNEKTFKNKYITIDNNIIIKQDIVQKDIEQITKDIQIEYFKTLIKNRNIVQTYRDIKYLKEKTFENRYITNTQIKKEISNNIEVKTNIVFAKNNIENLKIKKVKSKLKRDNFVSTLDYKNIKLPKINKKQKNKENNKKNIKEKIIKTDKITNNNKIIENKNNKQENIKNKEIIVEKIEKELQIVEKRIVEKHNNLYIDLEKKLDMLAIKIFNDLKDELDMEFLRL